MKNVMFIIFLLSLLHSRGQGILGYKTQAPISSNYMIIFAGESNASGSALNADALAGEIGVRSSVKVLNNDNLTFETLNIGVNNILGQGYYPQYHGWELGLANMADTGALTNPLYYVQTSQSGTQVSQWAFGGTLYNRMITRIDTAIFQRRAINGNVMPQLFIFYSQGINDFYASTNLTTWKNATKAHFASLRSKYGLVPIFMTYLPPPLLAYISPK